MTSLKHLPEGYRPWARAAKEQGWTIERRRKHLAWWPPHGAPVFTPATPGDTYGGHLRVRAKLRAAGLAV